MKCSLGISNFLEDISSLSHSVVFLYFFALIAEEGNKTLQAEVFFLLEKTTLLFFICSIVSDSLQPHGLQHARFPCSSPSPGACSNSCPLSQWCHPTILSSVIPFSSCLQYFPASGFYQWVGSLQQMAKVLELPPQHQFLQWIFRIDFL